MSNQKLLQEKIEPVERPVQIKEPQLIDWPDFTAKLVEIDDLINLSKTRKLFSVSGKGLTVAVLDTGLRTTHVDFKGRVLAQHNFTNDNGGNEKDAGDHHGHGTNVSGIICANKNHIGAAPAANIIPLKVLDNKGGGKFNAVDRALQYVIDNNKKFNITAACLSLGDGRNYTTDTKFEGSELRKKIKLLRQLHIPVVIAAGNGFYKHSSKQGMSRPAIFREAVSVGAVYDANEGDFSYKDGAMAFSSRADRITPFSQRLHKSLNPKTNTDIFAPGSLVTSSGIEKDDGESVQQGTSQAAPVTTGVLLLMQEYYLRLTNKLPTVDQLLGWMNKGGIKIFDGDDEDDNVENTNLHYIRIDALGSIKVIRSHMKKELLLNKGNFIRS